MENDKQLESFVKHLSWLFYIYFVKVKHLSQLYGSTVEPEY